MKKYLTKFICGFVFALITLTAVAQSNEKGSFQLVQWNVLKAMYKINSFVNEHKKTAQGYVADPVFKSLVVATFMPDAYNSVVDQNTTFYIHPRHELLGTKLSELKNGAEALRIVQDSITNDRCFRGFYMWIDNQEKYMVVCPLVGKTTDGYKLYVIYTVYTRSMPDYYLKSLKNAVME